MNAKQNVVSIIGQVMTSFGQIRAQMHPWLVNWIIDCIKSQERKKTSWNKEWILNKEKEFIVTIFRKIVFPFLGK
jgi:hypothetical protein